MEKRMFEVKVQRVYTKTFCVAAYSEEGARDYAECLACADDTFFDYDENDSAWEFDEDWFVEGVEE